MSGKDKREERRDRDREDGHNLGGGSMMDNISRLIPAPPGGGGGGGGAGSKADTMETATLMEETGSSCKNVHVLLFCDVCAVVIVFCTLEMGD